MWRRLAWAMVVIVALITGASTVGITRLKFDYEFEHFFPKEDSDLDFYRAFCQRFTTDVDFVLVAIESESGVFDQKFLSDARSLSHDLAEVRRVKRVVSPFSASAFAMGPFGPVAIPLLHVDSSQLYHDDSVRIYSNGQWVGSLFSVDGRSISMLAVIEEGLSKLETDTVFQGLTEVLSRYNFKKVHTAGKAVGQAYYIDQIRYEFVYFFTVGLLLIVLVLFLVYRSVWGIVVPVVVVLLSVVWLLGFMALTGKAIDIMIILLPLVLFVVGISDVIHLLSRYFEEIRNGLDKERAIWMAYKKVGLATFLTSFTTAVGFLTLLTSNILPVQQLGVYAAAGVMIAFVLAYTLLPALMILSPVPALAYREPSSLFWNKLVAHIFLFSMRRRKAIIWTTVVLSTLSLALSFRIEIDNYLMEDMGKDDPHRLSFEFFENQFAGVRPFELQVSRSDSASLFSLESVRRVAELERYLSEHYGQGVNFLQSPLTVIKTAHQALENGSAAAFTIPDNDSVLLEAMALASKFQRRPEFEALSAEGGRYWRITGKMRDVGGKQVKAMDEALLTYFENAWQGTPFHLRVTGMSKLIDKNNEALSMNMVSGLLIAILVVGLTMALVFRSWRLLIISIIPNLIPLLAIAGVMAIAGIDLKVSTSVIFSIAFGIAVDDTIHYLSKFRQERRAGRNVLFALRRTTFSTGKAIILTTLVLCAGFLALITSDFTSIYYVGLLISITLAVAVLADLLLLPILLLPRKKQADEKGVKPIASKNLAY